MVQKTLISIKSNVQCLFWKEVRHIIEVSHFPFIYLRIKYINNLVVCKLVVNLYQVTSDEHVLNRVNYKIQCLSLFEGILCKHTNPILSDSYKTVSLEAACIASVQLKWTVLHMFYTVKPIPCVFRHLIPIAYLIRQV